MNSTKKRRGLRSRKELFELLTQLKEKYPGINLPEKFEDLSNEVYGRKAFIYLSFDSMETRKAVEDEVEEGGFHVSRGYCNSARHGRYPRTEIRVAWFKGNRWWE